MTKPDQGAVTSRVAMCLDCAKQIQNATPVLSLRRPPSNQKETARTSAAAAKV